MVWCRSINLFYAQIRLAVRTGVIPDHCFPSFQSDVGNSPDAISHWTFILDFPVRHRTGCWDSEAVLLARSRAILLW